MKGTLNGQHRQWEGIFREEPDLYGVEPSVPARNALSLFTKRAGARILELGGGQGRDTLYFARKGFKVAALDYAQSAIDEIQAKAQAEGMAAAITALCHDVRLPLPFPEGSFDGCYSHMLYCMALTTEDLTALTREVRRVLKPGGVHLYTVRNTADPHYGKGIHRGEEIYETGGFAVHFFSREKVARLAEGFEVVGIDEFEEGELPRRLFQVALRKPVAGL